MIHNHEVSGSIPDLATQKIGVLLHQLVCVLMLVLLLFINGLLSHLTYMGGSPKVLIEDKQYTKIEMADNCFWELFYYSGDSVLIVQTVCAPICSSVSGMYTKKGSLIHIINSPDTYTFPLAQIKNGQILWKDNIDTMLDAVEKQRKK